MGASGDKPLTLLNLVNQLQPEHWPGWDEDELLALDYDVEARGHVILARLQAAGCALPTDMHGIEHGKDTRKVWDELAGEHVIELKPRHDHYVLRWEEGEGPLLLAAAEAIGVRAQALRRPSRKPDSHWKPGRYAHENALSYLTHSKDEAKHQYDPAEVVTFCGFDYQTYDAEHRPTWITKGRASVDKQRKAASLEKVLEQIDAGELTREEVMLTDELRVLYRRHKVKFEDAFSTYGQFRALRAAQKMKNGDFHTLVVYITGVSGTGKTELAYRIAEDAIARAAQAGENWQIYQAATKNSLDDYEGEEFLLLDDLRAAAMSATDWLLLLDPYHASPAAARYKNKAKVAPRVIVITSSVPPLEFFYWVRQRGEASEALDQFVRRLAATVKVIYSDDSDDVTTFEIGRIGRVPPYQHKIEKTVEFPGAQVTLTWGATALGETTEPGEVIDFVAGEIISRSPDLELPAPTNVLALESRASRQARQQAAHQTRLTEQARIAALEADRAAKERQLDQLRRELTIAQDMDRLKETLQSDVDAKEQELIELLEQQEHLTNELAAVAEENNHWGIA